jgi:hypothetical protein
VRVLRKSAIRNPQSENPQSEIRNPKIRNPKSEFRNPKSAIRNPNSLSRFARHRTPKKKRSRLIGALRSLLLYKLSS